MICKIRVGVFIGLISFLGLSLMPSDSFSAPITISGFVGSTLHTNANGSYGGPNFGLPYWQRNVGLVRYFIDRNGGLTHWQIRAEFGINNTVVVLAWAPINSTTRPPCTGWISVNGSGLITLSGDCQSAASACGMLHDPASGPLNQSLCVGEALVPIKFNTLNVNGVSQSNFPPGIGPSYSNGVVTVSGTLQSIPPGYNPNNNLVTLLGPNCNGNLNYTYVRIGAKPRPSFTAPTGFCADAGIQTGLGGGTPTGGMYSGPGVSASTGTSYSFNPAAAGGPGTKTITYTGPNGCSTTDNIEVYPVPSFPTISAQFNFCSNVDAILSATGSGSGDIVFYNSSLVEIARKTMGTQTQTHNLGMLAPGTYTFHVEEDNGNCQSSRVTTTVNITAGPSFTTPTGFCVDVSIQTGLSGALPTGGTYSGPGVSASTGTSYSFDPGNAGGPGTKAITYTLPNGCSATSNIEVYPIPANPSTGSPITACANINAVLSATGSGSGDIVFYNSSLVEIARKTMGTPLQTHDLGQLAIGNYTYYAEEDNGNCVSARVPITVDVFAPPQSPSVNTPVNVCEGENVILSATGSGSGDLVFYNSGFTELARKTMGAALQTHNTGAIAVGTHSFYVTEDDGRCESNPVLITANVSALPSDPGNNTSSVICEDQDVILSATGSGSGDLVFFNIAMTEIARKTMGSTTQTHNLGLLSVGNHSYFVAEDDGTCESNKVTIALSIAALPTEPNVNSPIVVCENENMILSATGSGSGDLVFYDNSLTEIGRKTMGSVLQTFDAGVLAPAIYTFYISEDDGTCESNSVQLIATVSALPSSPSIIAPPICSGENAIITATGSGSGDLVFYDNSMTEIGRLSMGPATQSFNAGPLSIGNHTFHITQHDGICESISTSTVVSVLTLPTEPTVSTPVVVCAGEDIFLSATGSGSGDLVFYDQASTEIGRISMGLPTQSHNAGTLPSGLYKFYVREDDGSCLSTKALINVTVNTVPNSPSVNALTVCSGDDVILNASGSGTGDLVFYDNSMTEIARKTMGATTQTHNIGSLADGNYTYYVSEDNGQCESAPANIWVGVTLAYCNPTISYNDPDGDGVPDIADPCSCSDLNNRLVFNGPLAPIGQILFHEVVTINSMTVENWNMTLLNSGEVYDSNGNPLSLPVAVPEVAIGIYVLEFWHHEPFGYDADFSNGVDILNIGNSCVRCPTPVPTMSEWGLIGFCLLLLNLGLCVLFVQSRKRKALIN